MLATKAMIKTQGSCPMQLIRNFGFLFICLFLLAGCGGGGGSLTQTGDGTLGGQEPTTDEPPPDPVYNLKLELLNSDGVVDPTALISQDAPGTLRATITVDGRPISFELVTFTTEITGLLNPTLGTAQSDGNGSASVTLLPGSKEGAGTAKAVYITADGQSIVDSLTFNSKGDAPTDTGSSEVKIAMSLKSGSTGAPTTNISAADPGLIEATVTAFDGTPITNRIVTFSSTLGQFRPTSGTALTDENGFASIILTAGSVEGAGEITASFDGSNSVVGFYSQGDEVDPNLIEADVSFGIYSCPDGWDREIRDISLCTETQNISTSQPAILYIQVLRSGSTVPLKSTLVSAVSTVGRISPDTGTAITDDNGIALLDLLAGSDVGAGEVEVSAITTTAKKAFEIGAAQVTITIDNGLSEGASLAAGATTVLSVSIFDVDGQLFIPPLNVEFTSNCAISNPPRAVLDRSVTSVGGIATATYRADGCSPEDTVTVTVITGGDAITGTVVVPVNEAAVGSLEFVGVSNDYISLKGTGGQGRSETSVVQFRVLDENANPVAQQDVTFELTNDAGGISISPTTAQSNNDGLVQTVVRSGDVPGAVRVLAYVTPTNTDPGNHDNRISAVSDVLIISTGLPDNNSFSLSAAILNPEGLDHDGEEVMVTAHLADHFNNPVPDGTSVFFTTEGGSVESGCVTANGRCSVAWRSQDDRPFADSSLYQNSVAHKCDTYFGNASPCTLGIRNPDGSRDKPLGGRFTILAHAVGEESFTDLNGNGKFDSGEYYSGYDLSEAFIDHNENNAYDGISCADASDPCAPANSDGGEFEEFWDFNNDNSFTAADGVYNGYLCSATALAAGDCKWEPLHVRRNMYMVMSGSTAYMRLITPRFTDNCADYTPFDVTTNATIQSAFMEPSDLTEFCDIRHIDLSTADDADGNEIGLGAMSITLVFSDIFNNPLPAGTTVSITADNGVLSGNTSMTVPSTNTAVPLNMTFAVAREGEGNKKSNGALTVTITTPKNIISSISIPLNDNR